MSGWKKRAAGLGLVLLMAGEAVASEGMAQVRDREDFLDLVEGRELRYSVVRIEVGSDGTLRGRALRWDITGEWSWQDGYFCREMDWGGYLIAYNCQEVRSEGNRMRFTSDRGAGDTAVFRLR